MAAPAKAAEYEFEWGPSPTLPDISPLARITHDISPPLIAMIAVLGTAFIIVLYARILSRHLHRWRRWRRRRRLLQSTAAVSDLESPPSPAGGASFGSSSGYFLPPYSLDDSAIKTLPISLYSTSRVKHLAATNRECAVCLLEFEDDDSLRTLPLCSHAFHVDCIDIWLQSHATCPLCRAAVFRHESPFVPMRAARIRPSLDDLFLDPPPESPQPMPDPETEIVPTAAAAAAAASPPSIRGVDRFRDLDSLLNRSYSFGFERSLAADWMILDTSTASPWQSRYRSFWSKRWPSPFGGFAGGGSSSSSRAARVSSFRSYRSVATKSPFFRQRGFFQLSSDPTIRLRGGAGAVVPAEPLDDEPVYADGGVLIEPVAVRGLPSAAVAGEAEPTVAGRRGVR